MEEKQKFHFIKTVHTPDRGWTAMIADADAVGGRSAVDALRSAARQDTFNAVRIRQGVHFYTAEQLAEQVEKLETLGMDKSLHGDPPKYPGIMRALACVDQRNGKDPTVQPLSATVQKPLPQPVQHLRRT